MAKTQRGKGEGAIFQRANGLWVARFELPSHTGKRRRFEITATTKARLHEKLAEPRKKFYIEGDLPSGSKTTAQWLTYWMDTIAADRIRPTTLSGYRSVVNNQIIPAIGRVRLDRLQPSHIRRVRDRIIASGLSPTYALNAHRVLAKALKDANVEGIINRNPAQNMPAPKRQRRELEALTVANAIDIIRWCIPAFQAEPYDPHPARWATYLLTGARRGEVLGLETDRVVLDGPDPHLDLSWQMQYLTAEEIRNAPTDYEYRHIIDGLCWVRPKSSAGWRVIPLVDPLNSILREHLEKAVPNRWGLVFTDQNGSPLRPDTETKRWPKVLAASKITPKRVRLHDLRHTTVDLLYEAGVPEDIIMEIVGHSTRSVTRGYKARGNQRRLTDAMMALSELLSTP